VEVSFWAWNGERNFPISSYTFSNLNEESFLVEGWVGLLARRNFKRTEFEIDFYSTWSHISGLPQFPFLRYHHAIGKLWERPSYHIYTVRQLLRQLTSFHSVTQSRVSLVSHSHSPSFKQHWTHHSIFPIFTAPPLLAAFKLLSEDRISQPSTNTGKTSRYVTSLPSLKSYFRLTSSHLTHPQIQGPNFLLERTSKMSYRDGPECTATQTIPWVSEDGDDGDSSINRGRDFGTQKFLEYSPKMSTCQILRLVSMEDIWKFWNVSSPWFQRHSDREVSEYWDPTFSRRCQHITYRTGRRLEFSSMIVHEIMSRWTRNSGPGVDAIYGLSILEDAWKWTYFIGGLEV